MTERTKKAFLLNTDEDLFIKFRLLCQEEGSNVTAVINRMMRKAIKNNKTW
jgi:hypothetical protein